MGIFGDPIAGDQNNQQTNVGANNNSPVQVPGTVPISVIPAEAGIQQDNVSEQSSDSPNTGSPIGVGDDNVFPATQVPVQQVAPQPQATTAQYTESQTMQNVEQQEAEQEFVKEHMEPNREEAQLKFPEGFESFSFKDKVFSIMVANNASDAYPVVDYSFSLKVSGKICYVDAIPKLTTEQVEDLINELLSTEQRLTYKEQMEIDFAYSWQGYRFRINAFHQMGKPSLTIRYLRNDINSMEALGLPAVIKTLAEQNSGIILLCGVTGSGKSTTLAAMVDYINENFSKHIITIEDPVEYTYEKKQSIIEQREVGTDTKSFASAMKSALRQNPNVLLLGEMRDLESIASAITIAESGHLVLATIHARNSVQCINKIIDAFPADQQEQIRVQLSEALSAIITQKLIPGTDGKLKLAMEIMVNNSAIGNMIREAQTHQIESVIQTSKKDGMQLLDEHILTRLQAGEITREDAILYANKPQDILNQIS